MPDLKAESLTTGSGAFDFRVHRTGTYRQYRSDLRWQLELTAYALREVTHVLFEAGRPMFGQQRGQMWTNDVPMLDQAGIKHGLVFHGSEIRDPALHRAQYQWSPFRNPDDELTVAAAVRERPDAPAPGGVRGPDLRHHAGPAGVRRERHLAAADRGRRGVRVDPAGARAGGAGGAARAVGECSEGFGVRRPGADGPGCARPDQVPAGPGCPALGARRDGEERRHRGRPAAARLVRRLRLRGDGGRPGHRRAHRGPGPRPAADRPADRGGDAGRPVRGDRAAGRRARHGPQDRRRRAGVRPGAARRAPVGRGAAAVHQQRARGSAAGKCGF